MRCFLRNKAICFGLVICAVAITFVTEYAARATNSWGPYHWKRSANPLVLQIVDNMTSNWDAILGRISVYWSASSVVDTSIVPGSDGSTTRRKCSPQSGKIVSCNSTYGYNGWLGIATIWFASADSVHIVQATTKLNDSYLRNSKFFPKYNNDTARTHVGCQEIGHNLGLDHQTGISCMNDDNNFLSDPLYIGPNAHDYEQLELIYGHLDSAALAQGGSSGSSGFENDEEKDDEDAADIEEALKKGHRVVKRGDKVIHIFAAD